MLSPFRSFVSSSTAYQKHEASQELRQRVARTEQLVDRGRRSTGRAINHRNCERRGRRSEDGSDGEDAFFRTIIARFAPGEEEEMVCLVRRTIELVVEDEQDSFAPTRQLHVGLFEQLCELNALNLIVDVLSGVAFSGCDGTDGARTTILLPPISVASQALQSLSYLIRHIVEPTSLFFILSNKKLQGLIDLPVELYDIAEDARRMLGGLKEAKSPEPLSGGNEDIKAKFAAFLRTLTTRINADTVHFFLARRSAGCALHPLQQWLRTISADSSIKDVGDQHLGFPLHDDKAERTETHFPLYCRALQFCSLDQSDKIVRLSAVKVCLDIIRLVTAVDDSESQQMVNNISEELRLEMARYICAPSRVRLLASPIITRLDQLFGGLQGAIRDLDVAYTSVLPGSGDSGIGRLRNVVEGILADIEVELMLLDDLLSAGLTFLNEQVIELFLEMFIYRLLPKVILVQAEAGTDKELPSLLPVFQALKNAGSAQVDPARWSRSTCEILFSSRDDSGRIRPSESAETDSFSSGSATGSSCLGYTNKSSQLDLAPAKAALIGIAAVFINVMNKPLLHLLFVALFNSKMPGNLVPVEIEAGDDAIVSSSTGEIRVSNSKTLCYDFGRRQIPGAKSKAERTVGGGGGGGSGGGGGGGGSEADESRPSREKCVFSLSPAIADIFMGTAKSTESSVTNLHRREITAYLTGARGASELQPFATFVTRAALSMVCKGKKEVPSTRSRRAASAADRKMPYESSELWSGSKAA